MNGVLRMIIAILLIFVLSAVGFAYWVHGQMQNYVATNYGNPLAHLRIIRQGTQQEDLMQIQLVLLDNQGHPLPNNPCKDYCILKGDGIELGGNTIIYPARLGFLSSGFKLTYLKSVNHNPQFEQNYQSKNIVFNGGDDPVFQIMQRWGSMIGVETHRLMSNNIPADGRTYNVFVSPTGLSINPMQ